MGISDKLILLGNIKANIKSAIANRGVEIDSNTPFSDYAEKISQIEGGGGSEKGEITDYVEVITKQPNFHYEDITELGNHRYSQTDVNGTWEVFCNAEIDTNWQHSWRAFCNDIADTGYMRWTVSSSKSLPYIIGLKFPQKYKINSIFIQNITSDNYNMKSFQIQGNESDTNDMSDTGWETLYTTTSWGNGGYSLRIPLFTKKQYRQFRLYITAKHDNSKNMGIVNIYTYLVSSQR